MTTLLTTLSIKPLVEQLHGAGLNLSLVPGGGLAVAPSSRLNDNLRVLIRSHKADLIRWFSTSAPNDPASVDPVPVDPKRLREVAQEYQRHHFKCRTCIAGGQGAGLRCGTGSALWVNYSAATIKASP